MLGRDRDLGALVEAIEELGAVVLAGPAGVGKTRLVRELLAERRAAGWTTDWVAATPASSSIPFGAFATLLPVFRTKRRAPARDSVDVLLLARHAILDRAAGRPYLLAIDDAHLLDEASALLAFQLAAATEGVALVLSVRDKELAPEPVTALWKEGLGERVYLRPLTRAKVTKLLEVVLGGPVDGLLAQQAWEASAGNLLYLRELIEGSRTRGQLVRAGGVWRTRSLLVIGDRLLDLIEAHLASVPAKTRRALEVVAVGEPLDIETLDRIADSADIEDGERRGLLTWESEMVPPVIRLAHPLYAEALRNRMPMRRRRSIVHDLADAFSGTAANQGEGLLRYVNWRLEIGEEVPADVLLQAARRALEAMDLALAERLSRASADAGGHAQARIFLAGVYYRQVRGEEALAVLDDVRPRNERQLTEIEALRVFVLLEIAGRTQDAEHVLDSAIRKARDPDCQAWLTAIRARIAYFGGYSAEAVAICAPLVERDDLSPRPLLAALSTLGPGLALSGRGDEALRIAERGIDPDLRAADELGASINWAVATMFLAHLSSGNLSEAEVIGRLQHEMALGFRNLEAYATGAVSLGWVALFRGTVGTAVRFFRSAEPHLARADLFGISPACLGGLAQALALTGNRAAAVEALRRAETSFRPGVRWLEWCVDLGRAWTASVQDRSAGAEVCLKAAETAHDRGQLAFAVILYHDAARLGRPKEALSSLQELASCCDGPLPPAALAHTAALVAGDRDGLLAAADSFEALGMPLPAAEAMIEAELLDSRRKHGRITARAAMLVARCEGAVTPTLDGKVKGRPWLTKRELAVARLASEGHSSKAIARQLGVSVRTVDSHLARAYNKLGVGGRQELAPIMSASGAGSDDW